MKNEITVVMEQESDRRESTHAIVDGKIVLLAGCSLPSLVERDTLEIARRLFGENVTLAWKF